MAAPTWAAILLPGAAGTSPGGRPECELPLDSGRCGSRCLAARFPERRSQALGLAAGGCRVVGAGARVQDAARGAHDDGPGGRVAGAAPAGVHRGRGVAALRPDARDQERQRGREDAHAPNLVGVGRAHDESHLPVRVPGSLREHRHPLVDTLARRERLRLQVVAARVRRSAQQQRALAGVALGHGLLAYDALARGLDKLEVDRAALAADLDAAWEVLAEPVQTVLRRHRVPDAYERLKELTRGRAVTREALHAFIASLAIPEDDKARLLALTPATYVGAAARLAREALG